MDRASILIVNGGHDPIQGKWLRMCVDKIIEHTRWPNYHLYIWNNNIKESWVDQYLGSLSNATLVNADPSEVLQHPHAVPLQRLYELARKDGTRYVLTMDTDAQPIKDGWLTHLISALNGQTVLAGIWRDEMSDAIQPYIHPSCLCTTLEFIESNHLRLDKLAPVARSKLDTLSSLTDTALRAGFKVHALRRSNINQIHHVLGGIYGDLTYHHGAGARQLVRFWDDPPGMEIAYANQLVRDSATEMLYNWTDPYLAWLRGKGQSTASLQRDKCLFVLGMHRSGTSCLAGCLERSGLFLGDVSRSNQHNLKGNYELLHVTRLHDEILKANGGSWFQPPETVKVSDEHLHSMSNTVTQLKRRAPCGLKDPRALLMMNTWMHVGGSTSMVGTFRHPRAVAQSLAARNQMPEEQAYGLWAKYNRELVELHKKHQFPLIEFDLSDVQAYCDTVSALAIALGLDPNLESIGEFVTSKLDHSTIGESSIPPLCEETYAYLIRHSYKPLESEEQFEVKMQKLLRMRSKCYELREEKKQGNPLSTKVIPFARRSRQRLRWTFGRLRRLWKR